MPHPCPNAFQSQNSKPRKAHRAIHVRPFTVLAGRNSTGKSFFSKTLYSVFNAVNAKHALVEFSSRVSPLREDLEQIEELLGDLGESESGSDDKTPLSLARSFLGEVTESVNRMGTVAQSCSLSGGNTDAPAVASMSNQFPGLKKAADDVQSAFDKFKPHAVSWISAVVNPSPFFPDMNLLARVEGNVKSLCEIGEMNARQITVRGLEQVISRNFSQNFQVNDLSKLKGPGKSGIAINVEGVGQFGVEESGQINFQVEHAGLLQLQRFSRVIYLESPVLWKLKSALDHVRNSPRFFFSAEKEQPLVPRYFYDLVDALRQRYTDDTDFTDLLDGLAKAMGGKVTFPNDGDGEMVYQEDGRDSYPLSLTAMGIANLGVLAMLIDRKIIGKGAFVFVDEPEAHLHPSWQVAMVNTLYELVRKGVHVVIATHSVDILKWLEVHVKRHPEDKELFALNHFTDNGVTNGDKGFSDKLTDIQQELTSPFHELYMRGL